MSTATIYAHRYDSANDERTGILGGNEPAPPDTWRFSIDVARAWEDACDAAQTPDTRKLKLRLAMLMNADPGGTFDLLLRLVRYGLGGRAGDGRQYMSWIHEHDFVRAIEWLIHRNDFTGPVNIAAPHPVPNQEFMQRCARPGARASACRPAPDARDRHLAVADRIGIDIEKPPRRARRARSRL